MMIRSAAVLGAGVMGAQVAAHLANAGVPVTLLDVTRDAAREGLKRARTIKPDAFFTPDLASLIQTGSFDEDLDLVRQADWIIEAIVERLDAKQAMLARIDALRGRDAIVSSNTSGIPDRCDRRRTIGELPPAFSRHALLQSTALPPPARDHPDGRYRSRRRSRGRDVCGGPPGQGHRDGEGHAELHRQPHRPVRGGSVLRAVERGDVTIEETDAITGPAIGRPKSATFRTMDIAGVDVIAHVANNLRERLSDDDERAHFELPDFVGQMIARGMTGAKAGRGFYEKRGEDILTLDPRTLEYRPRQNVRLPALDAAKSIESAADRIRTLIKGQDKVGAFLRSTLMPTLEYAARIAPEVAYSPDDVDRAMRWGFGWDVGPLALVDALNGPPAPVARPATLLSGAPVLSRNAGANLVDLGDGVLCVEFHSKMNAIGGDTIQMLHAGIKEASEKGVALVIGNDAVHFSAGANLMLLLLEAQEGNWDEVDLMVRAFQSATSAVRHAGVPVVVATAGLTLGGGCEIALHAARVQAHAETYMGLVEVGVGLIPAGGGTKEMLARAMEAVSDGVDPLPQVQRVFETIGFGKTSTSGADARRIGYLRDEDAITMNRDRLLADAKACALQLAATGIVPHGRATRSASEARAHLPR